MTGPVEVGASVETQILALPFWSGPVTLTPLVGGLSNKNFVAQDTKTTGVVRVGRNIPVHGIQQSCVQTAMRAATDIGVTPALRHASGDITVSDYFDGRAVRPADLGDSSIVASIVSRIRELHAGGDRIRAMLPFFWPFQVVRNYARYCYESGHSLRPDCDALAGHATALERLVAPFIPVLTHNDLVPQNMMIDAAGKVLLVDWDYGAYGHPLFDLAAIAANTDNDDQLDTRLLELYAGAPSTELWQQFRIFKLIVNLRELLWGAVQELTSDLDRDIVRAGMATIYPEQEEGYGGYLEMNRTRFSRNLAHFKDLYG